MKRVFNLPNLVRSCLFGTALATTTLLSPVLSEDVQASLHDSPKAVLDEAWQIVHREYVDTSFNQVDWQAVRQELLSQEYSSPQAAYTALQDALEQLDDPYTRFMTPDQYQQLTQQTSGELTGVGIRLRYDSPTATLVVIETLPNSPAAEAGLMQGDRILEIDGRSTQGMSVQQASELIRGEEGSEVVLQINRIGQNAFNIPITRARIELPSVHYIVRQDSGMRIGYIRLTEFSSHAAEQMYQAIQDLTEQNVQAFVLDLRGNPGGLLYASIDIARMWIDSGTIVSTVDRSGASEAILATHTALTDLPLMVLVDGNSASSSEILAGALMDNGRATVVGTQTYGKALVQRVHSLADGSGLAVTTAHYYTPNGTDISHLGLTPDVEIELTSDQRRRLVAEPELLGTTADPHYAGAIAVLRDTVLVAHPDIPPSQALNLESNQLAPVPID